MFVGRGRMTGRNAKLILGDDDPQGWYHPRDKNTGVLRHISFPMSWGIPSFP